MCQILSESAEFCKRCDKICPVRLNETVKSMGLLGIGHVKSCIVDGARVYR